MSPAELLARAGSGFQVVYLDAPTLAILLSKSMEAYQAKVGPMAQLTFEAEAVTATKPDDFLSIAVAMDADSVFHEASVSGSIITIAADAYSVKPLYLWYFQNFQNWDADTDLPTEAIHLISQHLIASIDILNSERGRAVAQTTGLDLEFPSDQELRERLTATELAMEENQAIIPGVVVM